MSWWFGLAPANKEFSIRFTKRVVVYYCSTIIKLFARGEGDSGGHVL
jgi:hypothetical protein